MKNLTWLMPVLILGIWGCAPKISKQEFAPKMYEQRPASILVLPPQNKTTAADAKELYTTTIAEPLTNSGYYVYSVEIVNEILKQEGLFDTETMLTVPLLKYREFFGADAVMYVTILEWDTHYYITAGNVTVKIACELKSTLTGETLWFYDDKVTVSTTAQNNSVPGLAGLLVQAVATAIQTAVTQYVPIARDVNKQILIAMPYGKYHPLFGKDGQQRIEKKAKYDAKKTKTK
ncbi:MAG: DUF799 family lipoprotein [Ignavibacteriales bacterium]|nr:DUF799 family lipoprotein [Ignavibacteriales bacterium]